MAIAAHPLRFGPSLEAMAQSIGMSDHPGRRARVTLPCAWPRVRP
ncbi:MAG: hypothetical protein ACOYMP_14740 [Nodosilinea sp.]